MNNYLFKWIDGVKWTGAKYISKGIKATLAAAATMTSTTSQSSQLAHRYNTSIQKQMKINEEKGENN